MGLFSGSVLFLCVVWVLLGPFVSKRIEERLELFILAVGVVAVTVSWSWSETVVLEAIMRPMKVCGAVLLGTLIFSFSHDNMRRAVRRVADKIGLRVAVGLSVALLGAGAMIMTAPVAVLVLVELLYALRLTRASEIRVAVIGSFAIGLGGGMTEIAGPIPAIVLAKLAQAPYPVGPRYLIDLIGPWVFPAIVSLGLLAGLLFVAPADERDAPLAEDPLSLWSILLLSGRLYIFIFGLVLLGAGIVSLVDRWLLGAPLWLLYWINAVSAVVDGATLASIEISPSMSQMQIRYILIGLLIAGGTLITGNAPNIVAAHKLKISQREWAVVGAPLAAVMMTFYFISLVLLSP